MGSLLLNKYEMLTWLGVEYDKSTRKNTCQIVVLRSLQRNITFYFLTVYWREILPFTCTTILSHVLIHCRLEFSLFLPILFPFPLHFYSWIFRLFRIKHLGRHPWFFSTGSLFRRGLNWRFWAVCAAKAGHNKPLGCQGGCPPERSSTELITQFIAFSNFPRFHIEELAWTGNPPRQP